MQKRVAVTKTSRQNAAKCFSPPQMTKLRKREVDPREDCLRLGMVGLNGEVGKIYVKPRETCKDSK